MNGNLVRIEMTRTDAEAVLDELWHGVNCLAYKPPSTKDENSQAHQAYLAYRLALRDAGYAVVQRGAKKDIERVEVAQRP